MALAFDATSSGNNGAGSAGPVTWSHTVTGSQPILLVAVDIDRSVGDQTVTGITYNSVALSKVDPTKYAQNAGGGTTSRIELWYLINPSTGANTISVSLSGSTKMVGIGISYTGVSQTTPLGTIATPVTYGTGGTSSSFSISETTSNSNSWLIAVLTTYGDTISSPSGTQRILNSSGIQTAVQDRTTTSPGSYSLSWTVSNSTLQGGAMLMVELNDANSITTTSTSSSTSSTTSTTTTSSSTSSTTSSSTSITTTSSSTTITTTSSSTSSTTSTSTSVTTTSSSTSTTLSTSSTITVPGGLTFTKRSDKISTTKKH